MRPLDPADGAVERFACELRALRAVAGELPFWKMARRCEVSKSALAAAVAGYELPSERVAQAFVQVCGGDWAWWSARLAQAHAQLEADADAPPVGDVQQAALVPVRRMPSAQAMVRGDLAVRSAFPPPLPARPAGKPPAAERHWAWRARTGVVLASAILAVLAIGAIVGLSSGAPHPKASSSPQSAPSGQSTLSAGVLPVVDTSLTSVDAGGCTPVSAQPSIGSAYDAGSSPYPAVIRPGDVQHPPGQIGQITPASGTLVPTANSPVGNQFSGNQYGDQSILLSELAGSFQDGSDTDYLDTGGDDGQFMSVDLATPKPGLCLEQLAVDGLSLQGGGGHVGSIHQVTTGPHLTAAHAVLECGSGGAFGISAPKFPLNTCTWAGPTTGTGTPFFGQFWIYPDMRNNALADLTEAQTAAFADHLFNALTH